jgi:hypothetical protein
MEGETGITAQNVYVESLPESNAFNLSLDNALREELRARGYTLTETPQEALHLSYRAFLPEDERKVVQTQYNGDQEQLNTPWNPEDAQRFVFALVVKRDGAVFDETRIIREVPAYGYVSGEGNVVVPKYGTQQGNGPAMAPAPVNNQPIELK